MFFSCDIFRIKYGCGARPESAPGHHHVIKKIIRNLKIGLVSLLVACATFNIKAHIHNFAPYQYF